MSNAFQPRKPRFKSGDPVVVIGPSSHRNKTGLVTDVIESSGDFVHRYQVRFPDGTSAVFFGFELAISDPE